AVTAVPAPRGARIETSAAGTLEFKAGTVITFFNSYVLPDATNSVEVFGSEGTLVARNATRYLEPGTLALLRGGREVAVDVHSGAEGAPHEAAVRAVVAAAQGEGDRAELADGGVKSLAVALAALESARTGCRVELANLSD